MEITLNFFLIIFILILILLIIYYPISGYYEIKRLKNQSSNSNEKIKFYHNTIIWAWVPILLIFSLIPLSELSLNDIGIKWVNFDTSTLPKWFLYTSIGLYIIHLIQNIYSIIVFKYHKKSRDKVAQSISEDHKWFLPINQREKQLWTRVSISAGITEEILYRGYLFFALETIFPSLSIIFILLISTLIFGIGHIYLGKDVIKSTFIGFLFGVYYIAFDSVFPIIIIHIAQDLVIRDLFNEDTNS